MGLLSDFQALSADQVKLATLNGNVVSAQQALSDAQAAVASETTTIGADTATVVADLQVAPYNGQSVVIDASQMPVVTVSLLTVVPPTTSGGQPGLSIQTVNVAA